MSSSAPQHPAGTWDQEVGPAPPRVRAVNRNGSQSLWRAATLLAIVLAGAACEISVDGQQAVDPERSLVGQVLLPPGTGSRGVEVVVTVAEANDPGDRPRDVWLLFDEDGRFHHTFRGSLVRVSVSTGIRAELYRIEAGALPEPDQPDQIDVGVIDLRERLTRHRLVVRAAEGAPAGDVWLALCFGPPPVGPRGESIALGSRQFPPVSLGSEVEWLLPHDAQAVHFLVERPAGSGRGSEWRSGRQQLFGPFDSTSLPTELVMD